MSSTPADFLLAERRLLAVYPSEVEFYEALQEATARLMPVDAFYVCLVQRDPDWLHFVYNCEGEAYDVPESLPFGTGPTSRVAHDGRPVVMSRRADWDAFTFKPFADATTVSCSALHWPLWIAADPEGPPDGVLSAQSYEDDAFGPEAQDAMAWIALRAATAMRRRNRAEEQRRAVEAAELAASRGRAMEDARRFIAILEEVGELRGDPVRLLAEVRRRQVEILQCAPTVPTARDDLTDGLARLSDRELQVLVHVAQGLGNEAVAEALMCSKHTVKRHLDNIYAATPLRNRGDVAHAGATIRALYMARAGHSRMARPGD